jgi:hypothetical protein
MHEKAEQALLNDPIPIYEQDVDGELRFVYCGETKPPACCVVTERGDDVRVVTATSTPANDATIAYGERKGSERNEQEDA